MSTLAASLALLAAVLHASWNAFLRGGTDRLWSVTVMSLSGTAVALASTLVLPLPATPAWPYVALSAVLQVGYSVFLVAAYRHGDLSQVYPMVRGLVPVLVTLSSFLFAGQHLGVVQAVGVGLVTTGLVGLSSGRRRLPAASLLFAMTTGLLIACYVLCDAIGVKRAGNSGAYTAWVLILYGILLPTAFQVMRGRLRVDVRSCETKAALAGGLVAMAAYGLVVAALSYGAAGPVTALRETSVVFAALIGRLFLGESLDVRRAVGCIVVALGAICLGYDHATH